MMSPIQHFYTAPPVGSANRFTALVYGDMGVSPIPRAYKTADYATEEANNGTAAFVIHNGDISYARGHVSETSFIAFALSLVLSFWSSHNKSLVVHQDANHKPSKRLLF